MVPADAFSNVLQIFVCVHFIFIFFTKENLFLIEVLWRVLAGSKKHEVEPLMTEVDVQL